MYEMADDANAVGPLVVDTMKLPDDMLQNLDRR